MRMTERRHGYRNVNTPQGLPLLLACAAGHKVLDLALETPAGETPKQAPLSANKGLNEQQALPKARPTIATRTTTMPGC